MKRLLLLLISFFLFAISSLKAQSCQPDYAGYIIPDTGIILPSPFPHAIVGVPGSLVVTIGIPSHRFYKPIGQDVKINWIKFNSLKNAEPGMILLDNNGDSTNYPQMNKATWHCMTFKWTPTKAGTYVVDFSVDANVILLIIPVTQKDQTVGHFTVIVDENVGITDKHILNSGSFLCNPNPFEDNTIFSYYSNENLKSVFKIYTLTGQEVYSKNLDISKGRNEFIFDAGDIKRGIYLSSLTASAGIVYRKLIKY